MATDGPKQMGGALKADFPFDPEWTNLNHGEPPKKKTLDRQSISMH